MEQTHALPPDLAQPHQNTEHLSPGDEVARLQARLATVERERDHLAAIVDILQEVSASLPSPTASRGPPPPSPSSTSSRRSPASWARRSVSTGARSSCRARRARC